MLATGPLPPKRRRAGVRRPHLPYRPGHGRNADERERGHGPEESGLWYGWFPKARLPSPRKHRPGFASSARAGRLAKVRWLVFSYGAAGFSAWRGATLYITLAPIAVGRQGHGVNDALPLRGHDGE